MVSPVGCFPRDPVIVYIIYFYLCVYTASSCAMSFLGREPCQVHTPKGFGAVACSQQASAESYWIHEVKSLCVPSSSSQPHFHATLHSVLSDNLPLGDGACLLYVIYSWHNPHGNSPLVWDQEECRERKGGEWYFAILLLLQVHFLGSVLVWVK